MTEFLQANWLWLLVGIGVLFIVNPLRGGGLVSLFSTHPPLEARVARLRAMRIA